MLKLTVGPYVGKLVEQIGETALDNGWLSYITYARNSNPSKSKVIKIGNKFDLLWIRNENF